MPLNELNKFGQALRDGDKMTATCGTQFLGLYFNHQEPPCPTICQTVFMQEVRPPCHAAPVVPHVTFRRMFYYSCVFINSLACICAAFVS